jgi:hypothetical protein
VAGKSVSDDSKIMDVSRPGKGKIIINSRPITAPVVPDSASSGDVTAPMSETDSTASMNSPSATRKVIKPINVIDSAEDGEAVSVSLDKPGKTDIKPPEESTVDAIPAEDASTVEATPDQPATDPKAPVAEASLSEEKAKPAAEAIAQKPSGEPESTDNLPTPKSDPDNPIAPAEPSTDQSGAAGVDELAKAAEQKRMESEKSREQAERDKQVDGLIKSKQYFVPIKHGGQSGSGSKWAIGLLIMLVVIAGAYLTLDAKLIENNIKLPYEFIKEDARDSSADAVVADPADGSQPGGSTEKPEENSQSTDPGTVTPEDRALDDDRKNELGNLQTSVDIYYSDNDKYPEALSDLSPAPTSDQLTDDQGQAYKYTLSPDKTAYVLTALLSDGTTYTLKPPQ